MQEIPLTCPTCHTQVRATDFFCFNCGTNLRPAPLSLSASKQITVYLGSFFLPPMGIIWGMKYLRENNEKAKIVGAVCVFLTIVSLVLTVLAIKGVADTVNQQINSQIPGIIGY